MAVSLFFFGDSVVWVQRTSLISLLHTVIAVGDVISAFLILLCFKFGTKLGIATGLVLSCYVVMIMDSLLFLVDVSSRTEILYELLCLVYLFKCGHC